MQEFLLIHQERPAATLLRRGGETPLWHTLTAEGLDAAVALGSVGLTLALQALYRDVFDLD